MKNIFFFLFFLFRGVDEFAPPIEEILLVPNGISVTIENQYIGYNWHYYYFFDINGIKYKATRDLGILYYGESTFFNDVSDNFKKQTFGNLTNDLEFEENEKTYIYKFYKKEKEEKISNESIIARYILEKENLKDAYIILIKEKN